MFEELFSPILINQTEIKNRIVYPSMHVSYTMNGELSDRHYHYYTERARGGAGIVTVGPVGINDMAIGVVAPAIAADHTIPSFEKLVQGIHQAGARAWIQLFHGGAYTKPIQIGGREPMAPSSFYSSYTGAQSREMSREEIKYVQEDFVTAAERAKTAGFDGVEIIASAGYLITQFLSPLRNQRTDEYGGSFENRIRFVREIIEQMRMRLGNDFPITIRMAGNDFVKGSNTDMETPAFAKIYEQAGVNAISVTGGWHEAKVPQMTMAVPQGAFAYLAQAIKNAVSIPVIASNRIAEPWVAEKILRDGWADMVSLGRVLMADPYWPAKVQAGHPEQIAPCTACLQGCMDEIAIMHPAKCMVNARLGFEGERSISKTKKPKRIMVIGAGPAGLEAAFRAAEAGHQVQLYEKSGRIGGQLWIAGTPPDKADLLRILPYYQAMMGLHGVEVFLNTPVDINLVRQKQPDHIIAAEGAEVLIPPIEGIDHPSVVSAWEVLGKDLPLGKRIAIIGGGAVGLETAHLIALKGTISPEVLHFLFSHDAESIERLHQLVFKGNRDITVFEMMPQAGRGVGRSTKWGLMNSLRKHGVKIVTGTTVCAFKDGILYFETNGQSASLPFDNIVNAAGSKPVRRIADALSDTGIPYSIVGDSTNPGQITDAIHQAYLAVMNDL